MKTTFAILMLSAMTSLATGIQTIDQTTLTTNSASSSGKMWYSGNQTNGIHFQVTNGDYTATSTVIQRGDSASNSWAKANANFQYLDQQAGTNAAWTSNNVALLNAQYTVLSTTLHPGASNYLGTVPGFYGYTLTQITSCDPLIYWIETAHLTGTNYDPADAFDWSTNGYWFPSNSIPTNAVWVTLATTNQIAQSGQLAWLTVNGSMVYSNYTTSPTLIGLFAGTTNATLNQFTNFSPVTLEASADNTNYWPVYSGYFTTNTVNLALVAATNSPAPGAFTTLAVTALRNPERDGTTNEFIKISFKVENMIVDGDLSSSNLTAMLARINNLETNFPGLTTNIQFTDTAVLGITTNTLYFTNGILKQVTSP